MANTCMTDAALNLPFSYSKHSGQSLTAEALERVSLYSGTDLQHSSYGNTKIVQIILASLH